MPSNTFSDKKIILILSLAVFLVLAVEIFNLTKISLWHDESFSALLVKYDFGEMLERIKLDVHPPLYYILLRGWNYVLGNSLFSLRLFSAFFSTLAIIGVFIFANQAFKNRGLALLTCLLYTLSYFQIQYAMEARMYSLGTFLVVGSGYLFLKALETKKLKWWILYAVSASAGIYTHYFAALWIVSQMIYWLLLIYKDRGLSLFGWLGNKDFRLGILSYIILALSYLPWLGTLLKQFSQVQQDYWIPKISIWSVPNTFSKMTFGGTLDTEKFSYVLVVLMVMIVAAVFFFLKKNPFREKWLILSLLFAPFFITILLSVKRPVYIDRYFIFGFPFYLIFLAGAILSIEKIKLKKFLVLSVLLGAAVTFPVQWNKIGTSAKPGMAAAAGYLNEEFMPGEKIFVGSSLIYFTFKYYNQTQTPAYLYAPGFMPHYSGTALLSPEDIIKDFEAETKQDDIVWMLNTTGFGNFQPQVPKNWQIQSEKDFREAYDYLGRVIITKYRVE